MSTVDIVVPDSEELSVEESHALMDALIGDRLDISRHEFLRRLDAGDYDGTDDTELLHLITLEPFAR